MSDLTTICTVGIASGLVCSPIMAAVGFDPIAMMAATVGCTVVQSLLEREQVTRWQLFKRIVGGLLLASISMPLLVPPATDWVQAHIHKSITADAVRAAAAAAIGGFARPALLWWLAKARKWGLIGSDANV